MKKAKKDMAFLCQFFYPEYVSSATLPYDVAEALAREGYSVGALVGYPKEYSQDKDVPRRETHNGIDIKRVKYLQLKRTGFLGRLINYVSFFLAILFNIRFLKDYKVVIVYSNPPIIPLAAVIVKKLYKTKIIFVSFDVYPEIAIQSGAASENGMMTKVFRYVNKLLFKSVDKVVAVCSDMKDFLVANRDVNSKKIVDIPNWYEDQYGSEDNERPNDTFTVSYFGNLGTCQDETTLIETICLFQNDDTVRFVFAGHGNKMDRLKYLKNENGWSHVVIYDFLQGDAFRQALRESDCFVVSLIDGLYGLCAPSKAYTYFMQGKPIICIMDERTEIALDITENNAGMVFDIGEAEEIAQYIRLLKIDKEEYLHASENARGVFVRKYEKNVCIQKFCAEVHALIHKNLEL